MAKISTTPPRPAAPARSPAAPPSGPQLIAKGGTHQGRVRDHNEDFFLTPDLAQIPPAVRQQRGELVIVADGMGGHAAGEVAARMAAERVMQGYYSSQADPKTALQEAIQQANAEIFHAQQRNAAQEGMGSTLVAAVFLPGRVVMAHVGDSRIYRLRGGRIEQLTQDHTWVNEKLRSKEITPEEATTHPYRSVITRAMGAALSVQPDSREENLQQGDVYLLCSDGLSNMVGEDDLRQALTSEGPQPAITRLINLANSRGGPDNITAAVVSLGAVEGATMVGMGAKLASRPALLGVVGGVAALAVLLLIFLFTRGPSPAVEPTLAPPTATAPVVAEAGSTPTVTAATVITPTSTVGAAATPSPIPTATRPAPKSTTPQSATRTPVKAAAPTLPAPALLTPELGYTAAQGSITFKWQAVPGAQSYRVETRSTREEFKEWKLWGTPTATEWTLHFDGDRAYFHETGTDYYWRVTAVDGRGQVGAYSEERRFVFNRQAEPTPEAPPLAP